MPSNQNKPSRIIYLKRATKFDMGEYLQNPPMIKRLYEEMEIALKKYVDLESLVEEKKLENFGLEIRINEASIRLEEASNMIKKLEAEVDSLNSSLIDKSKQTETLQKEKYYVEIELSNTKIKLEIISRNSFIQFFISVAATILLGFGVNIVTTIPSNWTGWVLILAGIIFSIVAFILIRKSK